MATGIGWGLVTNTAASWLSWQGYLINLFHLGTKTGAWASANLGVLVALAIGFVVTLAFSRAAVAPKKRPRCRLPPASSPESNNHVRLGPSFAGYATFTLAAWGRPRQAGIRWSSRPTLRPAAAGAVAAGGGSG